MPTIGLSIVMALCAEVAQPPSMELRVIDFARSAELVGEDAAGLDITFEVTGRPGARAMIWGELRTESGTPITIQDAYFRSAVPMVSVELDAEGTGRGVRRFSGEAIRMAMVDGPWEVRLVATETGVANGRPAMGEAAAMTPSFAADDFGEQVARVVHVDSVVRQDEVRVSMLVDVSAAFEAVASVYLGPVDYEQKGGTSLSSTHTLEPGMREIVLRCDLSDLSDQGIKPPFRVVATVADAETGTPLSPRQATVPGDLFADVPEWERARQREPIGEAGQ